MMLGESKKINVLSKYLYPYSSTLNKGRESRNLSASSRTYRYEITQINFLQCPSIKLMPSL